LNVRGVNKVKRTELHTDEILVPQPSCLEAKIAIEKLKIYNSPQIDQISAELVQAGGNVLRSEIQNLINSI
jgi:hypothetical protein